MKNSIPSMPQVIYNYAGNQPNKVIDHISPSQIGRCLRAHFYQIKHVPQTTRPNVGALLNFEVGFLWEEVMNRALQYSGIPFIYQLKLSDPSLDLEGTLDFAIYDEKKDHWIIQDSKTEASGAGVYRRKKKESFFDAHPEYVHQLNAYCLLLRNKGFKVGSGGFTIISKNDGFITEEVTEFPEDSLKETLQRIKTLQGYLERNEVPPCECTQVSWHVGYCQMGRPSTRKKNSKGKYVNTQCCGTPQQMKRWLKEPLAEHVAGI